MSVLRFSYFRKHAIELTFWLIKLTFFWSFLPNFMFVAAFLSNSVVLQKMHITMNLFSAFVCNYHCNQSVAGAHQWTETAQIISRRCTLVSGAQWRRQWPADHSLWLAFGAGMSMLHVHWHLPLFWLVNGVDSLETGSGSYGTPPLTSAQIFLSTWPEYGKLTTIGKHGLYIVGNSSN